MAELIVLSYPNLNKPFEVYMDSSYLAIGESVTQNNGKNVISCFSKKLNEAQRNYPVTEKELLGIAETLKHNQSILHGGEIIVYTNHKNLTYDDEKHKSMHPSSIHSNFA